MSKGVSPKLLKNKGCQDTSGPLILWAHVLTCFCRVLRRDPWIFSVTGAGFWSDFFPDFEVDLNIA